jgi:hypothetical protein
MTRDELLLILAAGVLIVGAWVGMLMTLRAAGR